MIRKHVVYIGFYVKFSAGTLVSPRLLSNDFFKCLRKSRFGLVAHFFGSLRDAASLTQQLSGDFHAHHGKKKIRRLTCCLLNRLKNVARDMWLKLAMTSTGQACRFFNHGFQ